MLTTEVKSSTTATVGANTVYTFNIDVSKTGYTPIGIVGFDASTSECLPVIFKLSTNTAVVLVRNVTSSSVTYLCTVTVLYVKNMS